MDTNGVVFCVRREECETLNGGGEVKRSLWQGMDSVGQRWEVEMTQKEGGTAGRGRERTLYQEHSAVPLSRLGPPHCPLIAPLSFLLPSPSSSPSCLSSYQPPSQIFPALPQVCPAAQAGSKEHAQRDPLPPTSPTLRYSRPHVS